MKNRGLVNGSIATRLLILTVIGSGLPAILVVSGCGAESRAPESKPAPVVRETTVGPVTVRWRMVPGTVVVDQTAVVEIEVEAPAGLAINMAPYRDALLNDPLRYDIHVHRDKPPSVSKGTGDNMRWRQSATLSFVLPGTFELPGAEVSFVDTRGGGAADSSGGAKGNQTKNPIAAIGKEGGRSTDGTPSESGIPEVLKAGTDPVTVVVTEQPGHDEASGDLAKIPVLDPVELTEPWSLRWLRILAWGLGVVAVTIATVLVIPRIRRRFAGLFGRGRDRPSVATPFIPPDLWAYEQLSLLRREELIHHGRIQEFYYRISDIMRGYVERRFGVAAPEMTTEEFLIAATGDGRFEPKFQVVLRDFLTTCDLVKYARCAATLDEDGALKAAEDMVARSSGNGVASETLGRGFVGTRESEVAR